MIGHATRNGRTGVGLTVAAVGLVALANAAACAGTPADASREATHGPVTKDGGHGARLDDAGGRAVEGGEPPEKMCGDTRSDRANCGRCGHDCRGGECTAGACQPVTLATSPSRVGLLIADGSELYWVMRGDPSTGHCPLSDCYGGPKTVPSPPEVTGLAVASGTAFWTNTETDPSGNKTSGLFVGVRGAKASVLQKRAGHIVVEPLTRNGSLYWVDYDFSDLNVPIGTYMTCTLPACSDARPIYSAPATRLGEFTVADGVLYFGYVQSLIADNFIWALGACPVSGCDAPTALTTTNAPPTDLSASGTHVAWRTTEAPISACATPSCAGGAIAVLARGSVWDLALDQDDVYFIDSSRQTVNRCPISGCGNAPLILADTQRQPTALLVTATDIYWATTPTNIVRLAK